MSEKKSNCCNWWMMILCCAVPIVAVLSLQYFGYQGYLSSLAWLLCPILHGVMMWFMVKGMKKETTE